MSHLFKFTYELVIRCAVQMIIILSTQLKINNPIKFVFAFKQSAVLFFLSFFRPFCCLIIIYVCADNILISEKRNTQSHFIQRLMRISVKWSSICAHTSNKLIPIKIMCFQWFSCSSVAFCRDVVEKEKLHLR